MTQDHAANLRRIAAGQPTDTGWRQDLEAAAARLEDLEASAHDCPACRMACKQCRCVEEERARVRTAIDDALASLEAIPMPESFPLGAEVRIGESVRLLREVRTAH
jgi:hypothetical protein